ncbi:hypothetical protein F2Q70_00016773 [Brassica cretica]|uniref:Replication protein A 70 kDa DNA-binding subunit B/D first OB fold domain-containing protein n=1 Tax=Brassica cretica TaxID=69181 RepID=A0A8S9I174_BRACR|nr:hypothetical protein F2Q70_00016773 [Brassica cretica]
MLPYPTLSSLHNHGYGYSERSPTLNDVKPFKDTWKVEIRVLHSWTPHSSYSGGDSFDFILPDKTSVKIHYTYKRNFFPRVKNLQVLDVIGRAIDIGDLQVVQVSGKEKKKSELTLTDTR